MKDTNSTTHSLIGTAVGLLTPKEKKIISVNRPEGGFVLISNLFVESGLRLSELVNIKYEDINWDNRSIKIWGKGRKEAYAPFAQLSEQYVKAWLGEHNPNGNIWGITKFGICVMLQRLEKCTDLPCNPHTFRRTFACLLRKAGVDTMTIKDLGRWESLEMVQRYTRSVTFQDSMKFYKAPLG